MANNVIFVAPSTHSLGCGTYRKSCRTYNKRLDFWYDSSWIRPYHAGFRPSCFFLISLQAGNEGLSSPYCTRPLARIMRSSLYLPFWYIDYPTGFVEVADDRLYHVRTARGWLSCRVRGGGGGRTGGGLTGLSWCTSSLQRLHSPTNGALDHPQGSD